MIILDTNVLSEPLRPEPHPGVMGWLDAQAVETLHLTTITLAEVRYGVAVLPQGRRRSVLHDRFEHEILPLFGGRVLPFDEPATIAYAELRSRTRSQGRPVGGPDALIAAIALTAAFPVATQDPASFKAAGAAVIAPQSQ